MTQKKKITIPFNFKPRRYQESLYNATANGYKRGVAVWHRRAGKDKTLINIIVKEAFKRVGSYYYFFPSYAQGRKIIWDGMDRDGFPFLGHIPEEVRVSINATEMKIKLVNGSLFQVVGSDNIDSIVGTNPVGCVFSEYALQDPRGWDFISPILLENGGWALFNFTPRGHNHGFDLFRMAETNPDWFCERLTIKDTGVLNEVHMDNERMSGKDEEFIRQEYYCSFEAAVPGAYYAKEMREAQEQNRITTVPYDPGELVDTWWDLGIGDSTAIWFTQNVGRELHVIDYHEACGEGLAYYAAVLQNKGYLYNRHVAPHDIEVRELGTGKSRKDMAAKLGIRFETAHKLKIDDGIQAVRRILPICFFDKTKCEHGIRTLINYRKDYDEKKRDFSVRPVHDWACHGADAFRTLGVAHSFFSSGVKFIRKPRQRSRLAWMAR